MIPFFFLRGQVFSTGLWGSLEQDTPQRFVFGLSEAPWLLFAGVHQSPLLSSTPTSHTHVFAPTNYIYIYIHVYYIYIYIISIIWTYTLRPLRGYHFFTRRRRQITKTNSAIEQCTERKSSENELPPLKNESEDELVRRRIPT